jgi:hypothetical protein
MFNFTASRGGNHTQSFKYIWRDLRSCRRRKSTAGRIAVLRINMTQTFDSNLVSLPLRSFDKGIQWSHMFRIWVKIHILLLFKMQAAVSALQPQRHSLSSPWFFLVDSLPPFNKISYNKHSIRHCMGDRPLCTQEKGIYTGLLKNKYTLNDLFYKYYWTMAMMCCI